MHTELAQYIMDHHASEHPDGSPKVDDAARAPLPDEDAAAAALRLLRLASSRGAFLPAIAANREALRTAHEVEPDDDVESLRRKLGAARQERELLRTALAGERGSPCLACGAFPEDQLG